jgi:hypothetical protein
MKSTQAIASKNRAFVPRVAPLVRAEPGSETAKAPLDLDETRVELDHDEIDRIVIDVRDHAHLNARRATQGKYK